MLIGFDDYQRKEWVTRKLRSAVAFCRVHLKRLVRPSYTSEHLILRFVFSQGLTPQSFPLIEVITHCIRK